MPPPLVSSGSQASPVLELPAHRLRHQRPSIVGYFEGYQVRYVHTTDIVSWEERFPSPIELGFESSEEEVLQTCQTYEERVRQSNRWGFPSWMNYREFELIFGDELVNTHGYPYKIMSYRKKSHTMCMNNKTVREILMLADDVEAAHGRSMRWALYHFKASLPLRCQKTLNDNHDAILFDFTTHVQDEEIKCSDKEAYDKLPLWWKILAL